MTLIRFAIFFSLVSTLVCGSSYYFLTKRLHLAPTDNKILLIIHVVSAFLMVFAPLQYRAFHADVANTGNYVLQFTQYYMMGWIGVIVIMFGSAEILQYLVTKFDPSKRIFLTEGAAKGLLTTVSIASLAGFLQFKLGPKIERVSIKLPTLPKSFDGFTIAQISDVHIGPILSKTFSQQVVAQTMELKADLIVITGDLVDGSVDQLREHVLPFQQLKADYGVYFITGNHEYYSGADEWITHLETLGIHVFRNSNKILEKISTSGVIEKLLLGGVYDLQGERFSEAHRSIPAKAAETAEINICKILLAHNPRSIEDAAKAGFHLQLSGHTHAGQFYPFTWIARMFHHYFEGLYHVNEKTQIYVNRGTGFWGPPNRLGKTGEITLITLKS